MPPRTRQTLPILFTALALSLAATTTAIAVEPETHPYVQLPPSQNAAISYLMFTPAFGGELISKINELDTAKMGNTMDPAQMPAEWAAIVPLLENPRVQVAIRDIITTSKLAKCDFELDFSQGFMLVMPHLGLMRGATRVIRADARRCLLAGDIEGATNRVAAIFRIAGHMSNDRILIGSLVGSAIFSVGDSEARTLLLSGRLSREQREQIAAAVRGIRTEDPFNFKSCIAGERDLLTAITSVYTGPDAGAQMLREMGADQGKEHYASIKDMDGAAIKAGVQRATVFYDDIVSVWDLPDAKQRIAGFEKQIEAGAYGELAKVVCPAVTRAYSHWQRNKEQLDALIESLVGGKK